jgi:hypothetical protein
MASVEIYIKNYKGPDGTVISTETLLQTIPMAGDPVITNPKVKTDLGKAGSFEFGLELNSPYYDAMMQMKTIMRVVYFGETLFRGRVLTIDKGMARSRVVHCEGDLAFLLDSHQVGIKDDARQKTDVLTYLSSVINQHNSDVDDSDKRFILGEAPSSYSDSILSDQRVDVPADKAEQKFGSSSYDTSMDRLEGLLSDFGGYMRTRYDPSDGTVFLDWLDNYYHPYSGQDIEVASNLIDLSGQTEVSNLFTIVLPIGKKDNGEVFINNWWPKVSPNHPKVDYIKVSELATIPLYSDEVLNAGYHRKEDYANANARFGKIWKPVEFENANTPQKLFNYAKDWIKNNFMPELTQWDVTALDLKYVGVDTRALFTGDRVKLVHPEVDQTFISVTIISAEYDLYNPDKNKFKIGIPNQQINASYGVKQKNASGAKSVNAGISTDNLQKELESKVNSLLDDLNRDRDILQQQYILKTKYKENIGLDDPWAFLKYETDCITEKDPETVAKETAEANKLLTQTWRTKNLKLLALQRTNELQRWDDPVKWNDPQLVIDNTPELKAKQDQFKMTATVHLVQDLNLPQDQAIVLLNDSIENTKLYNLVDDDGNWTQEAYDSGAYVWNPEIKSIIHKAKLAFDESDNKSIDDSIISSSLPWASIGSVDIGGGTLSVKDLTDAASGELKKVVSFVEDKAGIELTDTLENLKTSFNIDGLFNVEDIQNKITNGFSRFAEFLGGVINTKSISDAATGVWNKTIEAIGGALKGSSTEKNGDKETFLSIVNDLLTGSSKEKTGSDDVDKYVDILSGTLTGGETKTTSTGKGAKFFDFLFGMLTGRESTETGQEATKTFFLGNDKAQVDGTTGTASFGDGYEWMVTLNDTVGKERGFISAKDFQAVQAIPSFKTKFAAVDTFVANQATFNDTYTKKLTAAEAYINKINSTSVDADAYVSAGHGSFNSVNVTNGIKAGSYKITVDKEEADLSSCFSGAGGSFKDGIWTLTLYKIGGGSQDVPFDLTATDWYKNQIAGKYNDGWDAAVDVSRIPETISSSTEKGSMTASWPYTKTVGSNVTRGTTEMTFRLEVNQNDAFIRVEGDNDTYKDYAHVTHNQYQNGQNSVTVTSASIVANSVVYSPRPVTGTMNVRLSNMSASDNPVQLTVNLDDVYSDGLNGGTDYQSTADFEFDLTDGNSTWSGYFDDVDVSDIYQQGVDDATHVATGQYVYTIQQAPFIRTIGDTIANNVKWGDLLVDTEVKFISTYTVSQKTGIGNTTIQVTYYGVEYDGYQGYIRQSYLGEVHDGAQGDLGGWVSKPVKTIISVEVDVLQHIGYSSDIYIYMDPQNGPLDQYLSEFSSTPMAVTDSNTGKYLELIDGYYANHPVSVYSGTITHRAKLKVNYDTGTEYVVVEFTSNAVAPYQIGWDIIEVRNHWDMAIPISFTDANGRSLDMTCNSSEKFSAMTTTGEDASLYISGSVTYAYDPSYPSASTCRFRVRKYYSDGSYVDAVVQKEATREAKPPFEIQYVDIVSGPVHDSSYLRGPVPISLAPEYNWSNGGNNYSKTSNYATSFSTWGSNTGYATANMGTYFSTIRQGYYATNNTESERGSYCPHKMIIKVTESDGFTTRSTNYLVTFQSLYVS